MRDKVIRRERDGSFWEPSCPDDYSEMRAFADMVVGRVGWYFRRVVLVPRRWLFGSVWERTGEVWEFDDSSGANRFEIMTDEEARAAWGEFPIAPAKSTKPAFDRWLGTAILVLLVLKAAAPDIFGGAWGLWDGAGLALGLLLLCPWGRER